MVMSSVQGTIGSVLFPALSSCQHDKEQMKKITRRMIKSSCFLVFPMMFGLASVAKTLVLVLLTDKWLPCVSYLQFACITFAFWPLHAANLQAISAMGRGDIYLTLEVIKKTLFVLMILVTFKFGVMAMVMGQAACSLVCVAINAWPNRKLLDYTLFELTKDFVPSALLAAGMGMLIFCMKLLISSAFFLLAAQIIIGVTLYCGFAAYFKFESMNYLWNTTWQYFQGRRQIS